MANNNKEKIHPFTWVIAGIAIIFIIGVFGYQSYNNFQQKKTEQEKERTLLQEQLEHQTAEAKAQSATLEGLQQQVTDLKNRPPEVKTETKTIVVNGTNYTDITAEWQNRVAQVVCYFGKADPVKGAIPDMKGGSALLANIEGYGFVAITNRHVISDDYGKSADQCMVGFYGGGYRLASTNSIGGDPFLVDTENKDSALIQLSDKFLTDKGDTSSRLFDSLSNANLRVCPKSKVSLGDQIIVLGYPAIGTENGITVTEGIISGIDENYYVTSAKIDHGNSGGAAILIKYDCYLGIPTWVNPGEFESLGRILKMNF
jgi:hypothetical protein